MLPSRRVILIEPQHSSKAPDSFAQTLITTFQRSRAAGRFGSLHLHFMRRHRLLTRLRRCRRTRGSTSRRLFAWLLHFYPSCDHGWRFRIPRDLLQLFVKFLILNYSNLFLHFSECDLVLRPSQRGQPGVTSCSSTHLRVMYCLLMTRSLAAPPGLVFVGVPTMRSKASLL